MSDPVKEFRSNEAKRNHIRSVLQDPVVMEALLLLERLNRPTVPNYGSTDPALVLALAHAYSAGGNDTLDRLRLLGVPPKGNPLPPPKEWGDLNRETETRSE